MRNTFLRGLLGTRRPHARRHTLAPLVVVAVSLCGCVSPYGYYPYSPQAMNGDPDSFAPQNGTAMPGQPADDRASTPYGNPYGNPSARQYWRSPYGFRYDDPYADNARPTPTPSATPAPTPAPDPQPDPQPDPAAIAAAPAAPPADAPAVIAPTTDSSASPTSIQYQVGSAWQSGDAWFYPQENFNLDQTGVAAILPTTHADRTSDNERYDPYAMAAAMQAVQLPAIATVTNLDNGLQVMVRVNDRGPGNPSRLIAVTPGVASMLGIHNAARVRVTFDTARSMAVSRQAQGKAGDLAIKSMPLPVVDRSTLAMLHGTAQERLLPIAHGPTVSQVADIAPPTVPLVLPPDVTQGEADPGPLVINAGIFSHADAARQRQSTLADAGAHIVTTGQGAETSYAVQAGPYASIDDADAGLGTILQKGASDARIVVDTQSDGTARPETEPMDADNCKPGGSGCNQAAAPEVPL